MVHDIPKIADPSGGVPGCTASAATWWLPAAVSKRRGVSVKTRREAPARFRPLSPGGRG